MLYYNKESFCYCMFTFSRKSVIESAQAYQKWFNAWLQFKKPLNPNTILPNHDIGETFLIESLNTYMH